MIVSEESFVTLLVRERFREFTKKQLCMDPQAIAG